MGYWIKVEHQLPDKPEVLAIAAELGVTPNAVLGMLLRVWIWADAQLRDGYAPSVTLASLDHVAGASGFGEAMRNAGWIVVKRGGLFFPNFDRHNGQTAKSRALTSIRMLRKRYADVTPPPSPKNQRQIQNQEEPPTPSPSEAKTDQKSSDPAALELPASLANDAFRKAWADWCRYRAERKQKLTPTGAARLLVRLAALGSARACELIDRSISNGYQGLIFPEDKEHGSERVGRGDPPNGRPDKYAGVARKPGETAAREPDPTPGTEAGLAGDEGPPDSSH